MIKLSRTARQSIIALLFFLVMAGLYGAVIAFCNQLLRHYGLLTRFTRVGLIVVLAIGFYMLFRWFCRRLNRIVRQ